MDSRLEDVRVEQPKAGAAVVVFTGEHDIYTSKPLEALLGSLVERNEIVVGDFSEAEFVDSATIFVLVKTHGAATQRGSTFRLQLGTAPIVKRAFQLSGVLDVVDCVVSREEALRNEAARP
jgi:anti-anti-sigma factor